MALQISKMTFREFKDFPKRMNGDKVAGAIVEVPDDRSRLLIKFEQEHGAYEVTLERIADGFFVLKEPSEVRDKTGKVTCNVLAVTTHLRELHDGTSHLVGDWLEEFCEEAPEDAMWEGVLCAELEQR